MDQADLNIQVGLPEHLRRDAARLYLEAFGAKLGRLLGTGERAAAFLADALRPPQSIVALNGRGDLVGVLGFHNENGGFVGGDYALLQRRYGAPGAAWRYLALSLFERAPLPGEMLLDGVVVAPGARGAGVGGLLLSAAAAEARAQRFGAIRLDVVFENHGARRLYERHGFREVAKTRRPIVGRIFGFAGATTMRLSVSETPSAQSSHN